MSDPQALIEFPGIEGIVGGSFTLSAGVEPSVAQINSEPQESNYEKQGTLKLSYASTKIEFPDCIVVNQTARRSSSGRTTITTSIADRRWKWQFGHISGQYNARDTDGTVKTAPEGNKKSVKELLELLLDRMGESDYEIDDVTTETNPRVDWDYANPADELAKLARESGLVVHLSLDNKVKLLRKGSGEALQDRGSEQSKGAGVVPTTRPSKMLVVGGPSRFQSMFKLEPVGEDVPVGDADGEIKHIDELSYAPGGAGEPGDNKWEKQGPNFLFGVTGTFQKDGQTVKKRDLALRTVWRWFRIVELAEGGLQPMEDVLPEGVEIKEIEQYQFEKGLIDTTTKKNKNGDDVKQEKPPQVSGKWHSQGNPPQNTKFGALYSGDFDVDQELRIVKFKDPIYQTLVAGSGSSVSATIRPPELFLKIAYTLKDQDGLLLRAVLEQDVSNSDGETEALVIKREELVETYKQKYKANGSETAYLVDGVTRNDETIAEESQKYIDLAEDELNQESSEDFTYFGIERIEPDGSIKQIAWTVGGGAPATTRVGRNTEISFAANRERDQTRRLSQRIAGRQTEGELAERIFDRFLKQKTRS